MLAAVQDSERNCVEFVSLAALLRELHLTDDRANRTRVFNALELWAALSLYFGKWYEHGTHHERNFPPPVKRVEFSGRRILVTLAASWTALALDVKYFCAVPLPLPGDASAQNYALMALTSVPTRRDQDNCSDPVWRRALCRKIGLPNKAAKLAATTALANQWFARRGGGVSLLEGGDGSQIRPGQVAFFFTPLAVPRSKKGGSTAREFRPKGGSTARNRSERGGRRPVIKKETPNGVLTKAKRNEPAKRQAEPASPAGSWDQDRGPSELGRRGMKRVREWRPVK